MGGRRLNALPRGWIAVAVRLASVGSSMIGDSVKLLVFVLRGLRHAVPLAQVERVVSAVQVTPVPRAPAIVLGVIDLHGRIVPVLDVHHDTNGATPGLQLSDQFLIIQTPLRTVALLVDETHGVVERDAGAISYLAPALSSPGRSDGVLRLGDGLAVIHDVETFLSAHESRLLDEALAAASS
jgi:purine-binding chemotaxis protein CheW